jgi:predicted nucleotidyltransferase
MEKKIILMMLIGIAFLTKDLYAQQFILQPVYPGAWNGNVSWADYDNDGDLDILVCGFDGSSETFSKIYKNNGDNSFMEQTGISLIGVEAGSVAWGDYDNDGDLDIILTGNPRNNTGYVSKIYKNNGDNSFTEQTSISLIGVHLSSTAWGDYDNDGDLDILISGFSSTGHISKIYKNNGNNSFTEQMDISLIGLSNSNVVWGDYNNDGYLDILMSGSSKTGPISKIYKNNGDNSFTEQTGISLIGVVARSVAWGDYDNDGDLDILFNGSNILKIYKNDGNDSFIEQTGISIAGIGFSCAIWGDFDNNGYLDILLTGYSNYFVSKIYMNYGSNNFEEQAGITIAVTDGSLHCGDYDNDGDLDILVTGYNPNAPGHAYTGIYKNNNEIANIKPNTITNLQESINGSEVTFTWDVTTDNNQNGGLNYNLYIYDVDSSTYSSSGHAFPQTDVLNGRRLVAQIGKIQKNSHLLKLLPGNYVWSVQAIDASFEGSSYATEKSFTRIIQRKA